MDTEGVTFELKDAFDPKSYEDSKQTSNVAVASGLYELFSDNSKVLTSLRGIASSLEKGGYLICTGQPWHPQIEMIARTLSNRDGQPWIMRRRTQFELNDLLAEAGFKRIDSRVDSFGIFTVTIAQKRG